MRTLLLLIAPLALVACEQSSTPDADATDQSGVAATTNATVEPVPTATVTTTASPGATPTSTESPMPGNSTPIPADAAPSACGANKAAKFVGRIATPSVRAEVIEEVGHNRIRGIGPDTVVTMDFSESRLNMELNASNRITGSRCG
jgi:hypothetical protein